MGTIRKVGEGNKDWADRMAKKARVCGFVPTIKQTNWSPPSAYGNSFGVYIRQNKKSKVHDYYTLLVEPWKIK
jgi:hypothetical protein